MQSVILYTVIFLFVAILYIIVKKKAPLQQPDADIEKKILQNHVLFYQQLNDKDKIEFEKRIRHFLDTVRIQGIETAIDDRDKVFVAAAAIIPIFAFKGWEYRNIHEVLIYPGSFNHNYSTEGPERNVLGMVGDGVMNNLMILSLQDLRNGFLNTTDKSNTAIHEFVHLIDKDDGYADGVPETLLAHPYTIPWLKRIHQEIELIKKGRSDINPYAATNEAEFLAVASEYFFERPDLMERNHPQLYDFMKQVFCKK